MLLVILGLIKWGAGFVANVAVLLGIVAGAVLAAVLGVMHFEKVAAAPWAAIVLPLHFGLPIQLVPIVTMCIVMIVVMIESLGMFLALGEITGKAVSRDALTRGLRADGVGTFLGGLFNTFPYTSFSQNVGLVGVTGVRSRWVTIAGGGILLLLGLVPKMAALVEAVPLVVLGGAGLVMFGMVAATGARILTAVDFKNNRYNLFVVAISVGFGMIPLVSPNFFKNLPHDLHPLLESGILLCALVAVALNAFFNGVGGKTGRSGRGDRARSLRVGERALGRREPSGAWLPPLDSASPIRRIAPRRDQQRHVEMAFRVAYRKVQGNAVEKRRIGQRHAAIGKIGGDVKCQFVAADRHRPAADQRLVGAAVAVGDRARHHAGLAKFGQLGQFDRYPRRGPAAVGIQHMGRQAAVHWKLVLGRDKLIEPQRRDPADFPDRGLRLGLGIVRQPAFEIAQDGIPGVAANADDIGKAEFGAVGVVDALERDKFGIRKPIQAGAVLLGVRFRGEARGALGLVGEIGMRPDQRQPQFLRRAIDHRPHGGEQLRLTPANGRRVAACSAIHGEYSKTLPAPRRNRPCCKC